MNTRKLLMTFGMSLITASSMATPEGPEQLYQQALLKNQSGLLVDAATLLSDAISLDDQQAKYFYQRGLSFLGMKQVEHGLKDLRTAVDLKTTELGAYVRLIKHYQAEQQYMAVLAITDQLIANLPAQAAGAYHDRALAFEAMQQPQQALTAYQQVVDLMEPDDADEAAFKQQIENRITRIKQQLEQQP